MTRRPIPADLADVFGEALVLLVQWRGGAEEPVVVLDGKAMRISVIFELVAKRAFKDKVKLTRFRGHPNICVQGAHDGEDETTLHT
jgi:hypothetical protein